MTETETRKKGLKEDQWGLFVLMILVGGWLGAFTYNLRGGVFCNAQTANLLVMGIAVGKGEWGRAAYYLIPISAYLAGAVISELLSHRLRLTGPLRWDTVLAGVEILVVLALGLLPESVPYQVTQVAVNFICSMQFNTFRQFRGEPMATTFCTNHIRLTGVHLAKWLFRKEEGPELLLAHVGMLAAFALGAGVCTALCPALGGRVVWGAAVLLAVVFVGRLRADLAREKQNGEREP